MPGAYLQGEMVCPRKDNLLLPGRAAMSRFLPSVTGSGQPAGGVPTSSVCTHSKLKPDVDFSSPSWVVVA